MQQQQKNEICKVLVVDDEPPARMRLRGMLDELQGFIWVGEACNGEQALQAAEALQPDVVLMDIRMPGIDGLQAAQRLATITQPPAVIFCTAYDEHALAAFDTSAVAYLLKPIKLSALEQALQKATVLNRAQLASLPRKDQSDTGSNQRYVRVKTARGEERVPLRDIRAMIADNKYVSAYTAQREIILDQSLRSLEAEYADYLQRVHRNALVAKPYVIALEKLSAAAAAESGAQYCVALEGIEIRPVVSRRHVADLRRLLRDC
ncbi:MAG: LytTR family DNA-binding domain-containing protein [Pseudomonadales bacterium]